MSRVDNLSKSEILDLAQDEKTDTSTHFDIIQWSLRDGDEYFIGSIASNEGISDTTANRIIRLYTKDKVSPWVMGELLQNPAISTSIFNQLIDILDSSFERSFVYHPAVDSSNIVKLYKKFRQYRPALIRKAAKFLQNESKDINHKILSQLVDLERNERYKNRMALSSFLESFPQMPGYLKALVHNMLDSFR
jgi:hypothetical protein